MNAEYAAQCFAEVLSRSDKIDWLVGRFSIISPISQIQDYKDQKLLTVFGVKVDNDIKVKMTRYVRDMLKEELDMDDDQLDFFLKLQ